MCPDLRALSAYFDGETPSHLTESVRSHLRGCPQCQTRLERLKSVRHHLTQAEQPDDRYSKARVWARLKESSARGQEERAALWRRRVDLPLPLVALAAGLFVLLGFALVLTVANRDIRMMKITTEPSGVTEVQVAAPIRDLEKILQYLEKQDSKMGSIIRLPANSEFFVLGEPVLLRAKDLTQSTFK